MRRLKRLFGFASAYWDDRGCNLGTRDGLTRYIDNCLEPQIAAYRRQRLWLLAVDIVLLAWLVLL